MPARTHVVKVVFLVLCLGLFVLQSGCSSSGGGTTQAPASTGNVVHLALSTPSGPPAVVADGHSTIVIRLQITNGSGAGIADVPVIFATTAGSLSASSRGNGGGSVTVTTDTNGIAPVLLTSSTTAGTALVTADALGFRANITIFFVPGPAARVQLSASATTVNAQGTATLTATVTDANGNAVSNEPVTFTLSTNTSGATLSPLSAVTNTNGQATVQYTAGPGPGADTVQAKASTGVAGSVSITVLPSTNPTLASQIVLLVSDPQLESKGTGSVTLTALVRNAANNAVSGIQVTFAADSGSIQVVNDTTGPSGTATALLTTGGDPRNRTITVMAKIGTLSSSNTVQVTGTTLTISGASTLVLGATTQLTILLRDSGGTGIQKQNITVSSALGNTLNATTVTTDVTGQAKVAVTARVAGTDTLTVSGLGATATATLSVSADNFILTAPAPGTDVPLNTPQTITMHWDRAGVPQGSQKINFFATRATLLPMHV